MTTALHSPPAPTRGVRGAVPGEDDACQCEDCAHLRYPVKTGLETVAEYDPRTRSFHASGIENCIALVDALYGESRGKVIQK